MSLSQQYFAMRQNTILTSLKKRYFCANFYFNNWTMRAVHVMNNM